MIIRIGSVAIASVLIAGAVTAQTLGSVSGRILAEDTGLPLEGVTVNAVKASDSGPIIARAVTSVGGEFILENVSPGLYRVCVHEAGEYLNPCEWDSSVSLKVGASSSRAADIQLKRGAWLSVRIADPNNVVAALDQKLPGSAVSVLVTSSSGWSGPLPLTATGHGVYEYSKLVLPNSKVSLVVNAVAGQLGSAQGYALTGNRYTADLNIPALSAPTKNKVKLPLGLDRVQKDNTTVIPLVIAAKP